MGCTLNSVSSPNKVGCELSSPMSLPGLPSYPTAQLRMIVRRRVKDLNLQVSVNTSTAMVVAFLVSQTRLVEDYFIITGV